MRNRILIPFALIAVAVALAVAGCGGDDETSSTAAGASGASGVSGAALTEDEFVTQGNAICAAGTKELNAAAEGIFTAGQEPTDAQLQQYAEIAVPSIQGQIDGIRALPAPESIADQVDTFLDDAQTELDKVEADPSLLAASDDPFADVSRQAEDLGLDECAT